MVSEHEWKQAGFDQGWDLMGEFLRDPSVEGEFAALFSRAAGDPSFRIESARRLTGALLALVEEAKKSSLATEYATPPPEETVQYVWEKGIFEGGRARLGDHFELPRFYEN